MNNNIYCGLINHGNTCFFSSAFQNLVRCSVFINFIMNLNSNNELIVILKDVLNDYLKNNNKSISPLKLIKFYQKINTDYSIGSQEDAEEVITLLIGKIDDIIKQEIKEGKLNNEILKGSITTQTMIEYLFGIDIRTETKCSECNNVNVYNVTEFKIRMSISSKKNLDEIINGYSEIEKMEGDDQYFCNKCNKKVDAFKLDKVMKTPKYLHVQLKRFEKVRGRLQKIDDLVSIPIQLKINTKNYDLRGCVYHSGGINGGHYIYYYNRDSQSDFKKWVCLDDSRISERNITNEINKGYVFLYVKQK